MRNVRYENRDGDRVLTLDDRDYRELRHAAETYRADLVVRLAGEVGLRPAEVSRVRPGDLKTRAYEGRDHHFLAVPDADGNGATREAYLPPPVEHDIRQFVRARDLDEDERMVSVTPRRVQMLVSEVADRAVDRTGDERFRDVSSRTLRQYFARRLLVDERVHPRIVQAVGGWPRLASLEPYLDEPDHDEVIQAFERTSLSSREGDDAAVAAFRQAVEHSGHSIYVTDRDGVIEYVNPQFEVVTGYSANEAIGRTPRILKSGTHDEAFYEALWDTITAGEVWEGSLVNQRNDGEQYRVHQTIAPIEVDGTIERFVAVNTDFPTADGWGDDTSDLARLDAVLDRLHAVRTDVTAASTRSELERLACERLVEGDAYQFACFASAAGETLHVRTSAGIDEAVASGFVTPDGPAGTAVRTGEVQTAADASADAAFDEWASLTDERRQSTAVVPVVDGETTYGVLLVGADGVAYDRHERALLADLGQRLGGALTVVEQRTLLLADSVVELAVETTAPDAFFVEASAEHGCELTLDGLVPGGDDSLVYFVTLSGASANDVLGWMDAHDAVTDARLIRDYGDETLIEVVLTGPDPSKTLVRRGGTVTELTATDGTVRVVAEVSPERDVGGLIDVLTTIFPATELVTKRERERLPETTTAFRSSLREELTEKQAAVLEAAYHAGYFEWPRGSTAEELADAIGITSPTLHNHLRRAEQKLLTTFFEDDATGPQHSRGETPWSDE